MAITNNFEDSGDDHDVRTENESNLSVDIRSYKCMVEGCGKTFASISNLSRHSLIHSGDKPYKCEICNKGFNQQGNLKKHVKSHENAHLRWNRNTTDKPFKCPQCTRSFTVKSSLQNHMLSHQKVAPTIPSDYSELVTANDSCPVALTARIVSKCLHSGCTELFTSQKDLRSHLFGHSPGLAAEFKVMTQTITNLISMIENWDIKTPVEKAKDNEYIKSLKVCMKSYPLIEDEPTKPKEISYKLENDGDNTSTDLSYSYHNSALSPMTEMTDHSNHQFYSVDPVDNNEDDLLFRFEDTEDLDLFDSMLDIDYHTKTPSSLQNTDTPTCVECKPNIAIPSNVATINNVLLPPELQAASKTITDGWMQHAAFVNTTNPYMYNEAISLDSKKRRMIN